MKSAAAKLYLQAFFQRSRDHLFQGSTMKNILYVDEAFVAGRALRPEKRSPAEAKTLAVSDAPVDELGAADVVVLAVPRASSRDPKLKRRSVMSTLSRTFLKSGLYLAAILLVPGALIGAPLLWWLGHQRKKNPATDVESMLLTQHCQQPWRKLGGHCTHC
jgi:hypothetical protein